MNTTAKPSSSAGTDVTNQSDLTSPVNVVVISSGLRSCTVQTAARDMVVPNIVSNSPCVTSKLLVALVMANASTIGFSKCESHCAETQVDSFSNCWGGM